MLGALGVWVSCAHTPPARPVPELAEAVPRAFAAGIRTHLLVDRALHRPDDVILVRTVSVSGPRLAPADDGLGPGGIFFELIDPVGDVRRELLAIEDGDGVASGSLRVPLSATPGAWTVRATTRDGAVRERMIVVVGEAPSAPETSVSSLSVSPEGGGLVVGLRSRVTVEAADGAGAPLDGRVRIEDDAGAVLARLSLRRGLGRASVVPEVGRAYRAVMEGTGDGLVAELPLVRPDGCVLETRDDVDGAWDSLGAVVRCSRTRRVVVAGAQDGALLGMVEVEVPAGEDVPVELAPEGELARAQGVAWVGVLTPGLAPLAERLVYRNRGRDLRLTLTVPAGAAPDQEVALEIRAEDPEGRPVDAVVAISALDASWVDAVDEDLVDVRAALLLEGTIGPVRDAAAFLDRTDPDSAEDLERLVASRGAHRRPRAPVGPAVAPPLPEPEGPRRVYLRRIPQAPGCDLSHLSMVPSASYLPGRRPLVGCCTGPNPGRVPAGAWIGAVIGEPLPPPPEPPPPDPFGGDPDLVRCFERELPRTPDLSGTVEITVAYGADGKVRRVDTEPTSGHRPVLDCIERVAARRPYDGLQRWVHGSVSLGEPGPVPHSLVGPGRGPRRPAGDDVFVDPLPGPNVLWSPSVRTGPDGVAVVPIRLPSRPLEVRILAEGTGSGLAGAAWSTIVVE